MVPYFFPAVVICVLLIAGCHRQNSEAPPALPPDASFAVRVEPGQIVARSLRSPVSVDGRRFQRLSSAQTGIDFANRIDTSHPLKRLYNSGFVCGGVSIGDVDGDGKADIYLVSGSGQNRLYRHTDTFKFEDATATAGVDGGDAWGTGAAMADVDDDGDLDIYVCNYESPNLLYINSGDGSFSDRAAQFGVDFADASLMAAFCDYDADGDLDLYLLTNRLYRAGGRPKDPPFEMRDGKPHMLPGYERYYTLNHLDGQNYEMDAAGRPDRLFRNDGGKFTDVTESTGIHGVGHGLSVTWWDYDNDGWPDIYVGNDFQDPDRLYRNNGDGTFKDVLEEAIPHTSWFSMGADAADINNDGRLDLLIGDMSATNHYKQKTTMGVMSAERIKRVLGPPPQVMRNAFYLSTGTDRFMEIAYLAGVANTDWTWSIKFGDYDNDGRVDLAVTNGMVRQFNHADRPITKDMLVGRTEWELYEDSPTYPEQNLMFRNGGELEFQDVSEQWGFDHVGMSFAAAYSDLDRDGDLDMVVVNVDEPVSIYRNNSAEGHRLLIRLVGTESNRFGIGARVRIETAAGVQVRELSPMTGFLSCNEPIIHFGLGDQTRIDRLTVRWPNGGEQVFTDIAADMQYTIAEPSGEPAKSTVAAAADRRFVQSATLAPLRHFDAPFDDFQLQPLLPNKLSQLGPGMAWGDVNGDGLQDLYLSQGAGYPGMLLINLGNGDFRAEYEPFQQDKACEDLGAVLFDADGDGDLDLYVVSGSLEQLPGHAAYADRLYLNDGKGGFVKATEALPADGGDSGSCVVAADYDRDGDLDLFVGGRVVPAKYPSTPRSRLLRNDAGKFSDVTRMDAPGLEETGLVTAALWTDVDDDGWVDLMVTHEWGPVKLWRNHSGRLADETMAAGLAGRTGWWNGIAGRDLDNDGDIDYVVTNFGLNTKYHATPEKPALLYYGDFEGNGRYRIIEAEYEAETLFPVRGKSCSTHAMPYLADRFKSYHEFAKATLADIYTPKCLGESIRLAATELRSGTLINDGKGAFKFSPLPRLAQASPGFGIVLDDFDGDGRVDAAIAQNFFSPQLETGRMDSGVGLLLTGDGDGTFTPIWPNESGLIIPGDAKSMVSTDLDRDGWPDLVVGVNNDDVLTFINTPKTGNDVFNIHLKGRPGNPTSVGARVTLTTDDGSHQTAEVYAGSGYLSQSWPRLTFGLGDERQARSIRVRWPDGKVTDHGAGSSPQTIQELP